MCYENYRFEDGPINPRKTEHQVCKEQYFEGFEQEMRKALDQEMIS